MPSAPDAASAPHAGDPTDPAGATTGATTGVGDGAVDAGPGDRPGGVVAGSWVLAGAACLSVTAVIVELAGVDAPTTAFLRCAVAVLLLAPFAVREARRHHALSRRGVAWSLAAGLALGTDYSAWTASIYAVGAGVATVLINVNVVVLPLLGRVLDGERVPRRFAVATVPMLLGVGLVGGLGSSTVGGAPLRGTALALLAGIGYACYLYLTRRASRGDPGVVLQPLVWASAAAAGAAAALSPLSSGLGLAHLSLRAWVLMVLLALLGQALAFAFVNRGSPALASSAVAALLLAQPVLALVISRVVLDERVGPLQVLGVVLVLGAVAHSSRAVEALRPRTHRSSRREGPRTGA